MTRLVCFGHNLHLGVINALKDDSRLSRALGVCKKIVSSFSYSWKKKRELSKGQSEMKLLQHSLIAKQILKQLIYSVHIANAMYTSSLYTRPCF